MLLAVLLTLPALVNEAGGSGGWGAPRRPLLAVLLLRLWRPPALGSPLSLRVLIRL